MHLWQVLICTLKKTQQPWSFFLSVSAFITHNIYIFVSKLKSSTIKKKGLQHALLRVTTLQAQVTTHGVIRIRSLALQGMSAPRNQITLQTSRGTYFHIPLDVQLNASTCGSKWDLCPRKTHCPVISWCVNHSAFRKSRTPRYHLEWAWRKMAAAISNQPSDTKYSPCFKSSPFLSHFSQNW